MPRSVREYLQHILDETEYLGYFGVDYEIVWDIVTSKVPGLAETVRGMLDEEIH